MLYELFYGNVNHTHKLKTLLIIKLEQHVSDADLNLQAYTFEPQHDKTNIMICASAKTQINLGIRPD